MSFISIRNCQPSTARTFVFDDCQKTRYLFASFEMEGVQGISSSGVASDESAQCTEEGTLHFYLINFAGVSGKS